MHAFSQLTTEPEPPCTKVAAAPECAPRGVVIGEVINVDADGRVWLRLPLRNREKISAACCLCQPAELRPGRRVAVLFQEQNADLAVVIAPIVTEWPSAVAGVSPPHPGTPGSVLFEAEHQITLRCGKASIQLQADGSVLIRGQYVLSRASGTNRIRGGNVQIN